MRVFLVWFGMMLVFAACRTQDPSISADVVFRNGRIWTGVEGAGLREALAVRGSEILAVGSNLEAGSWIGRQTVIVDLGGDFVMPGFIDSHTHFVDGGFQLLGVDLRSALDEQDLARRIAKRAGEVGEGSWITGGDWDHESWPSQSLPTRNLIDPLTPANPVFVSRLDGHMALANSIALRMAGITRETQDPPGGLIVRDSVGEPTGILKDAAMDLVNRRMPERTDGEIRRALQAAVAHAAELGVTTVNAMVSFQDIRVLQDLLQEGTLTVRVYAITPVSEFEKLRAVGLRAGFGNEYLKIGAVKGFVDGSLGSSTAWFQEPYLDQPESSGLPSDLWLQEGRMRQILQDADDAGLQLVIHAIGDRANDELLDIFQSITESGPRRDRRFRIEHAQHLSAEAIPRFQKMGVIPSMQPYHAIDDGRWAEKKIGRDRLRTTYAFRSLLDAGARVAFGSDWTVAPLNPLLGLEAAVNRRTLDGKNPDGWVPQEKISVEEALLCYTRNGAYAIFEEGRLGSLEEGKLADLVVLTESPLEVQPQRLKELRVLRTVVGGRTVFQAP